MMPTLDALRSYVTVTDAGCWTWQRGKTTAGYGVCYLPNQQAGVYTHRLAYELAVGPIPAGLTIDHLCRNRACCNPAHLEPVTQAENVRRAPGAISNINAAKTHCPQGHEYAPANTLRTSDGSRRCRECNRQWCRARSARMASVSA